MADTIRTLDALQTLLADNTGHDISPQDLRDMLVSVFSGDSTAIRMKTLTGTTAGAAGGLTSVAHGVTASKIVSVSGIVIYNAAADQAIADGYSAAAYNFSLGCDTTYVDVVLGASASSITSKPFVVTVFYEN
jgi:hypothetical protein